MTRREAWLSAGILFVLALVVRALVASTIPFPTPEDTAYYVGVARNLVDGHGLVSNAIWSYGTPPLAVPARRVRGLAAAAGLPGRRPDAPLRDRASTPPR